MSSHDPVLSSERRHLIESRAALHRMREATTRVEDAVGGDAVSTQYLKQTLYRRMRLLFGFRHCATPPYEYEDLTSVSVAGSRLLAEEIERPRTGPMRDIVATIQPDQDVLVRTDLTTSLCIQGAPGTGKTAVGLHRAAYLLYAHRDQLSRSGVLVVGPNESFLGYIGDVLPALGEIDARQTTADGLLVAATGAKVRGTDRPDVATLKLSLIHI